MKKCAIYFHIHSQLCLMNKRTRHKNASSCHNKQKGNNIKLMCAYCGR